MSTDNQAPLYDCRNAWSATVAELARENERIAVVVNDSVGSSKLDAFREEFPTRTINVGIAEQDMVGVGAGLANGGYIPFVSAAGSFLATRAFEQIKVDAAYSQYNVKLIAQSPGVAYGDLGPTHHSVEDLTLMRALPGLTVVAPVDPRETEQVIRWAAEAEGPTYIRISRMPVPAIYPEDYEFQLGKAVTLREGSDVTLIATGTVVSRALDAAKLLEDEGIFARVISMPTIKPIDREAVVSAARDTKGLVTVEEGLVTGLGGAVAEVVVSESPCPVASIGLQDEFAITGKPEWLLDYYGASPQGIADSARKLVSA